MEFARTVAAKGAGDIATPGHVFPLRARDGGVLVERKYRQQRLIPAFMEPRSVIAEPVDDGGVKITTSTQIPHILRVMLALTLGQPVRTLQ